MKTRKKDEKKTDVTDETIALNYADTKVALAEATARVHVLTAHKDALELAYAQGAHYKEAMKSPVTSDEGIGVARLSGSRIVNLSLVPKDHRLQLSVGGVRYTHVSETLEGHWIYRHDT